VDVWREQDRHHAQVADERQQQAAQALRLPLLLSRRACRIATCSAYGKGKTYTLDNGQVWQQIDDAELAGVRLTDPEVRIKPAMVGNSWYMAVGKYNSRAQVKRIK
jgi:hypothetical protein